MSFLLDVVLIVVCVAIIVIATKRGFVRSLMSFVSKIVALIAAYTFTPVAASFLKTRFILEPVTNSIATTLRQYVVSGGEYDFAAISDKIPQPVMALLERYNVTSDVIRDGLSAAQTDGEVALRSLSEKIADPVVTVISTAASFLAIFLIACLVLWIVTLIVNALFKLPVLRTANTLLGFILGVCTAALIVFVYSSVISSLVTSLGSIAPKWFGADVIDKTLIVKFFANHDLLSIVQNIIS